MGWNAGGYGEVKFPNAAAIEAWRKSEVSADSFDDWPENLSTHFENTWVVGKSLKKLEKLKNGIHLALTFDGLTLTLLFDSDGDVFRDWGGQLALTLRGAAAHGATGKLTFLGTAGAEYDFAYELTLAKGKSVMKALGAAAKKKVYEGAEYEAFNSQIMERLMATDPAFKKIMSKAKKK